MDFLSKIVGQHQQSQGNAVEQNSHLVIEKLCDRLRTATLTEDKRAAVLSLKGLSRQYQLDVGTMGMQLLLETTRDEFALEDEDLIKAVLDTFVNLCDLQTHREAKTRDENLGLQFSQILLKNPETIAYLVETFCSSSAQGQQQQYSFHVQYSLIELLRVLINNDGAAMQRNVLNGAGCLSNLVRLLDDRREVLRNEGVLLLIDLTRPPSQGQPTTSYQDVQKIVAFEDVFDRALQMVQHEGQSAGDVIVEDCLQLVLNLLRENVSNQNYFRESGLVSRLVYFFGLPLPEFLQQKKLNRISLTLPPDYNDGHEVVWQNQQCRNLNKMLDILNVMVHDPDRTFSRSETGAGSSSSASNKVTCVNSGLWYPLMVMALVGPHSLQAIEASVAMELRSRALFTLASVVRGCSAAQSLILNTTVRVKTSTQLAVPLVAYLLQMCLESSNLSMAISGAQYGAEVELKLRWAAFDLVSACLQDNEDFKLMLISFMNAPSSNESYHGVNSTINGQQDVGPLLLDSLLDWQYARKRRDGHRVWFAVSLLTTILNDTRHKLSCLQIKMPSVQYAGGTNQETVDLFTSVISSSMYCARDVGIDYKILSSYMQFIAVALTDSPQLTTKFLADSSRFSFMLEQIQSSTQPTIQGLAAYIIGLCFEFNENTIKGLTRGDIQSIVIGRVGTESFGLKISKLRDIIAATPLVIAPVMIDSERVMFDEAFVAVFKSHSDSVQRSVTNPHAIVQKERQREEQMRSENIITNYKKVIADQDASIAELKHQLAAVQIDLSNRSQPTQTSTHQVEQSDQSSASTQLLEAENAELKDQMASMQQEMDDLLVCLAEQDLEMKRMRSRLRQLGDTTIESESEAEQ